MAATVAVPISNDHQRIISKHTPVPFLLEAFPVPPSHIPPSPNPPPSLPPNAPLPPLPGPSCDTLLFIKNTRRPSISSSTTDPQSPISRTRARNGSLSSLRSFHSATGTFPRNPSYDFISEEGPYNLQTLTTTTLRDIPDVLKPSFPPPEDTLPSNRDPDHPPSPPSELPIPFPPTQHLERAASPDVSAIIQATPRPRSRPRPRLSSQPRSCVSNPQSRSRASSLNGNRSSGSSKPLLTHPFRDNRDLDLEVDDEDARDSDSSIDLHTPLPHLMLRHGLLSPHSKLLPTSPPDPSRLSIASNFSQASLHSNFSTFSNQSDASLITNSSTGSKHPKDSRDTPSRRVRHRDGRLLRGGIGLTTGLGWSDRSVIFCFTFLLSWPLGNAGLFLGLSETSGVGTETVILSLLSRFYYLARIRFCLRCRFRCAKSGGIFEA
ncbi:hypothetical protein DFH29DRAFT_1000821 [Suillus ampliporus]|nr:hypothetical protein DFH29DRAFT_1000821 [Suillus ampliporus]